MNERMLIRWSRLVAFIILALSVAMPAKADIDKKFYEKAARLVWSMDMPQFNPQADLSDSIYQNQSAVIIARYNGLVADYDQSPDLSKQRLTGVGNSNAIKSVHIKRFMVKLNDAAAVEKFTEFSVDAPKKQEVRSFTVAWAKYAFGARVIKPDGVVRDVDMREAVTVTEGKKNKDSEYKIAISGLEPGDVLDYFYYDEFFQDEVSMEGINVWFMSAYPTRCFIIDIRVAPELAMEYGAYNGAPVPVDFTMVEGKNRFFLELENIESINEEMPYFASARQIPFIRFFILNNTARLEFVPKPTRAGGIRRTNPFYLSSDLASYISWVPTDDKCVDEAVSITKEWMKKHPDADNKQIADAAYMALRYAMIKQDNRARGARFAVQCYKVMQKVGIKGLQGVAATAPRSKVPVNNMIRFDEPEYMVKVGDDFYFSNTLLSNLPGELLPGYDGESFLNLGHPMKTKSLSVSAQGNLPQTSAVANTLNVTSTLKMVAQGDDDVLDVTTVVTAKNTQKAVFYPLIPENEAIAAVENYLGLKHAGKKKNDKDAGIDEETRDEIAKNTAMLTWGGKDAEMTGYHINCYGVTPDSSDISVTFTGMVKDAVTQAGDDIVVNIGRFICEQQQIKGDLRKRDVSIIRDFPARFDVTINFEIPEGYELVPESLEDLNRAVIFRHATFNSTATVEGNIVTVRVAERYPRSINPTEAWEAFLAVSDACYEFMSASVVLRHS